MWGGGGGEEENDFCELLFSLAQSSARYFPVFPDVLLIILRPAKLCFFRLVRLFWFFFFFWGGVCNIFHSAPPPPPLPTRSNARSLTILKGKRLVLTVPLDGNLCVVCIEIVVISGGEVIGRHRVPVIHHLRCWARGAHREGGVGKVLTPGAKRHFGTFQSKRCENFESFNDISAALWVDEDIALKCHKKIKVLT